MPYGWLKTAEKEDFIHPRQECLVVLEQRSRARAFLWAVGGFDKGGVDIKSLDRSINKRSAWISFEISQYADYVIAELNLFNRSTVWDCGSLTEPLYPRLSQCVFLSALGPACWQWRDAVGGKKVWWKLEEEPCGLRLAQYHVVPVMVCLKEVIMWPRKTWCKRAAIYASPFKSEFDPVLIVIRFSLLQR